jgi:hypothetical protein
MPSGTPTVPSEVHFISLFFEGVDTTVPHIPIDAVDQIRFHESPVPCTM